MLPLTFITFTTFAWYATAIPFSKPAPSASPYDNSPYKSASPAPGVQSEIYGGRNNGTLHNGKFIPGQSFDRIITIWLEGADYQTASQNQQFQEFQKDALLMNSYFGLTHPSEPNYMAQIYGTFWGLFNDDYSWIPENMTNIFDLMNERQVSWACYEENMPYTGFQGYNYSQPNYLTTSDNYNNDNDDDQNNQNNHNNNDNDGDNDKDNDGDNKGDDDEDDDDDDNGDKNDQGGDNKKSKNRKRDYNDEDENNSSYTYYARKHNPCSFPEESGKDPKFAIRNRNFNDFAADLQVNALPQWVFITPNLVNNGHDTSNISGQANVDFTGNWLNFWLKPLMEQENFNSERTLIILTYDANISEDEPNQVYTLAMGNALPEELKGQTDDTFYTHYSSISTIEANWGLKNLGRGDVEKPLNNVYKWVAEKVNYENDDIPKDERPSLNSFGYYPGPLNPDKTTLFFAPNSTKVIGAGGRDVLIKKGCYVKQIAENGPPSMNLTALNDSSIFHSYTQEFGAKGPVFVGGNRGYDTNNAFVTLTSPYLMLAIVGAASLVTFTIL